jgi:hypothetical protein
MGDSDRLTRSALRTSFLVAAVLLWPGSASPAELTAFISGASPGEFWGTGFGGSLAITLFDLGGIEIEGAHQGGEVPESSIFTLSGRVFLAPPTGRLIPYGGLGVGGYRASLSGNDDWGTVREIFVGLKLRIGLGFQIRGEYEWVHLPDGALLPMDGRYSLGATLRF